MGKVAKPKASRSVSS
jgi:hypothetical protein